MIDITETPNPESKKFIFSFPIVKTGSKEIKSLSECKNINFAKKLFETNLIELIFIDSNFITIKKLSDKSWDEVSTIALQILSTEIKKDFIPLSFEKISNFKDDVSMRIEEVLSEKIRPAVAMDGGDIQLKSFKDGIAEVMLKGSCAGCPSSVITLKQGVERMLKHYVPEVNSVTAVNLNE